MTKERVLYLDVLRIIAILGVLALHVQVTVFNPEIYYLFWSIATYCLPIFFMISGAIFLNKETTIKLLYSKYILRIVTAFIFWSFLYAFIRTKGTFVEAFLKGEYHMWFIFVIIGLYMLVPLFKKIIENKKILKYYLGISFIVGILIPSLQSLLTPFLGSNLAFNTITEMPSQLHLSFFASQFYFVMGYYLYRYGIPKAKRIPIYLLGLVCVITTIIYKNAAINEAIYGIAVFLLFKEIVSKMQIKPNVSNIIGKIAKLTFGVYLVHILVMKVVLNSIQLPALNTFILFPILLVIVYLISLFVAYLFSNIPILNKYVL